LDLGGELLGERWWVYVGLMEEEEEKEEGGGEGRRHLM
jgi:hypothetical protein